MCGSNVHWMHALILGPLIIAAAYTDAKWLSYAIGGTAIAPHLYLERDKIMKYRPAAIEYTQLPRWKGACSTC